MQRDYEGHRSRYPKYFWAPVWISIALVVLCAVFILGSFLSDQQWESEYRDRLAVAAMRSPGDALNLAEEGVEKGRIDFSIYRELLTSALGREDGDARGMALKSIANVLAYGGAFSGDLQRWFRSKPPQVFIYVRKDIDEGVGRAFEEELKQHGMDVIGRGAREPSKITKTEVFCYDETVCKQSAQFVVSLLQGQGYQAEGPTQDKRSDVAVSAQGNDDAVTTQVNDAMMLLNKSRIDVVLAEGKTAQLGLAEFDVIRLQEALKKLGHVLPVDGKTGRKTSAALKAFQANAGLPADGVFTTATRDAILKALANS
jgi:hypothetical protein